MIEGSLKELKTATENHFSGCSDFSLRAFGTGNAKGFICFFRNITDRGYIADRLVMPLVTMAEPESFRGDFNGILQTVSVQTAESTDKAYSELFNGNVFIAFETDRLYTALVGADSYKTRSIGEPNSDVTVKGPKAGFVESYEDNMAQLRRIIRSEKLKFEKLTLGKLSNTNVVIAYVEGRADPSVTDKIRKKLQDVQAEYIVDSANIEQLLEGKHTPLMSCMGSTEKIDKAASKLLAGRVAVICDGSPFVLTAPYVFIESLQSAEDYLKSPYYSCFIRIIRFTAFILAVLLPAVFAALMYHHPSLLPDGFRNIIEEAHKDIPLSIFGELLLMLGAFEIIREVGVRMPRTIGDAAGIVGSIILGDAAVQAGLASVTVIIIVALSAVSAYVVPAYMNAAVVMRFVFLFIGFLSGFYGLGAAVLVSIVVMCRKKSFGVPFMTPIYPLNKEGLYDTLLVLPKKVLGRRELDR